MRRSLAVGVLAAWLFTGAAAHATTLMAFTVEELVQRADVVAWVRIGPAVPQVRGRVLHTVTTVRVEHVVKGAPPATLRIAQLGGRMGDHVVPVSGTAEWSAGERVLVFLRQVAPGEFVLAGMSQGVMRERADGALDWHPTAPLWREGRLAEPGAATVTMDRVVRAAGRRP